MAWSSTVIDLTTWNLGHPSFVATNLLASAAKIEWRTSGSFASGSDGTSADHPTTRLYDGHHHEVTKPGAAGHWYLIVEWADGVTIDTICMLGHNFYTEIAASGVGDTYNFQVQIADNNAFTSNLQTLFFMSDATEASGQYGSDPRLLMHNLFHTGSDPRRYSNVRWMRFVLDLYIGTPIPEIGELWVGQRSTFGHNVNRPIDPSRYHTDRGTEQGRTGIRSHWVRYKGQRIWQPNLEPNGTTEIAQAESLRHDYGTGQVLLIPDPTDPAPDSMNYGAPKAYPMELEDPDLEIPETALVTRELSPVLVEQAPLAVYEWEAF